MEKTTVGGYSKIVRRKQRRNHYIFEERFAQGTVKWKTNHQLSHKEKVIVVILNINGSDIFESSTDLDIIYNETGHKGWYSKFCFHRQNVTKECTHSIESDISYSLNNGKYIWHSYE